MKDLLTMDHIGYAVKNIAQSAALYVAAGWTLSPIYDEQEQRAKIAFLTKPGMTLEGDSPVDNILRSQGVSPYHICYVVEDIMTAVENLYEEDFKPLFMPIESVAMGNRKICYLYHPHIGYIELVSKI